MILPLPSLVAFAGAFLAVLALRPALARAGVIDRPNPRSSHRVPTPRAGGLGILAGFLAGLAAAWLLGTLALPVPTSLGESSPLVGLLVAGMAVALVGLLDDLRSQPVALRLAAHVAAAVVFVAIAGTLQALRLPLVGEVQLGLLAVPLTLLWLVAVTNIFNFMDGIDGLAAGQAAIAGLCLALAGVLVGNWTVGLVSGCLAASAAGFLVHNFPPARIFMGDVGSTFLGFTFAGLAVLGAQPGPERISIYVSALLLAPFLFDGLLTLASRIWRGERWYEPHRSHLYQRLVRAGYSHRQVSLLYYLLALVLGTLGVVQVSTGQGATETFLLVGLVPLIALALWVRRVESAARQPSAGVSRS